MPRPPANRCGCCGRSARRAPCEMVGIGNAGGLLQHVEQLLQPLHRFTPQTLRQSSGFPSSPVKALDAANSLPMTTSSSPPRVWAGASRSERDVRAAETVARSSSVNVGDGISFSLLSRSGSLARRQQGSQQCPHATNPLKPCHWLGDGTAPAETSSHGRRPVPGGTKSRTRRTGI